MSALIRRHIRPMIGFTLIELLMVTMVISLLGLFAKFEARINYL